MSLAENVTSLPQSRSGNYEVARFNALRHGVLSRHTVLPWEDGEEYRSLLEAFVAEHKPKGRPRSISSRSWQASSGASGACDSERTPLIIAPSRAPAIPIGTQQRRR